MEQVENATRFGSLNEELKDYGSKPFVVNIEEVTKNLRYLCAA